MDDAKRLYEKCYGESEMPALIAEKAAWLQRILPCRRMVDFGGMWRCNGFYTFLSAAQASEGVVLVDAWASETFLELQANHANVRWEKMDFWASYKSGELWKLAAADPADALIFYDILLHQPEPLPFVAETVKAFGARRAVIANPVAPDSAKRSDLTFVPGPRRGAKGGAFDGRDQKDISPSTGPDDHGGWVWIFSHGYLLNALEYFGLEIKAEKLLPRWGTNLSYSLIEVAVPGA